MIKWIRRQIKIFKIKYIQGECRHICMLCNYRDMCMSNYEDD